MSSETGDGFGPGAEQVRAGLRPDSLDKFLTVRSALAYDRTVAQGGPGAYLQ